MDKSFDKLTPEERKIVLKGLRGGQRTVRHYKHHFSNNHVRFGVFSDPHIGSTSFDWKLWGVMCAFFKKEGITKVYCPGDVVEGMAQRPGSVYELEAIGFRAQVNLAAKAIDMLKGMEVYAIGGNHDLFFKDKSSVDASIGEALEGKCKHFHYLGDWEADVELGKGVVMKLFHPNDGTAYATSYKLQKLIESLESGKKPQILLEAHYHKALYMFCRGVHGFECGTICSQTGWMRGKKIPAHKGFWIIDVVIATAGGIETLTSTFYPSY